MKRQWLIKARADAGLSQKEVSQKAGISQQYYANLEGGIRGHNLPVRTAQKIAEVLNLDWTRFYQKGERDALTPRSSV